RGMVSAANLKDLEQAGFEYIVGMKMRNLVEVRDEVLGRVGRYPVVSEEAQKDRHDREALLEKLRTKLASGGVKALINNRGYQRYLKVARGGAELDPAAAQREARYDGKYVLRTTTALPAAGGAE